MKREKKEKEKEIQPNQRKYLILEVLYCKRTWKI